MGAGLRTQRRRYDTCQGSLGERRCQHETGCAESVGVCMEERGAAAAKAVRGGGAWLAYLGKLWVAPAAQLI